MKRKKIKLLFVLLICTVLINSTNIYAQKESYVSRYDCISKLFDYDVCNIYVNWDLHNYSMLSKNRILYINSGVNKDEQNTIKDYGDYMVAYKDSHDSKLFEFMSEYRPTAVMVSKEVVSEDLLDKIESYGIPASLIMENVERGEPETVTDDGFIKFVKVQKPTSGFIDVQLGSEDYPFELNGGGNNMDDSATRFLCAEYTGIIDGCGNGKFNPDVCITKEDISVIVYRMLTSPYFARCNKEIINIDLPKPDLNELSKYSDGNSISEYACESVSVLIQLGFIEADNKNNLNPRSYLTETEVNTICKKLHELLSGYGTYGEIVIEKDRELKVY